MKTVLALRGAANTGKSATLRLLIEMIKSAYPNAILEEKAFKVDVTIIFTIDGKKVGIETQGDPRSRLEASLKRFMQMNCKVIVCASRSYGQTVDLVSATASSGYQVKWFEKTRSASNQHTVANKADAERMFAALESALDA